MKLINTNLKGCYILEPEVFRDHRGWFCESYSRKTLSGLGINVDFVQDNRSFSANKGTLRGMHCQTEPFSQAKLITCTRGSIVDVVVDVREGSETYLKYAEVELSRENMRMLFVPKGFLHGFLTLEDNVEIFYKVDNFYSPEHDRSVNYLDPSFNIDWGYFVPTVSEKDRNAPFLADSDVRFHI